MRLNFELMNNLEHNCFDGLIASFANWNGIPYSFSYGESWDFTANYEMRGENVFVTLNIPNTLNKDLLKDYCGVCMKYIDFDIDKESFMTILKEELARQRPIIIVLDYYYCPWRKEVSNIVHRENHASLVVGYNEYGLICLDYSPKYDNGILPYENIINITGYVTLDINSPTNNNYNELITRSLNLIKSHDIFNAMREFANHIEKAFDPQYYLSQVQNNAWLPFVFQLSVIAETRCLYARTLRSISDINKTESLIAIAERLDATKRMWEIIKLLFVKMYNSRDLSPRVSLAKKIYNIADFEEDIYSSLVSISNKGG